jgi:hypothetical protein
MLAPPEGLTEEDLVAVLGRGWGIEVAGLDYRTVGFGSHHWEVVEAGGARWFVTADEPDRRRLSELEPAAAARARLAAAIGAARSLVNADSRFDFVVAPIPSLDGQLLLDVGDGYCAALYPMLEGESFSWGAYRDPDQRAAVLSMLIQVHSAAHGADSGAPQEDYALQRREELEHALAEGIGVIEHGPYSEPLARLLSTHEPALRVALRKYDELVDAARDVDLRRVLTHGEPHPGNTMLTLDGWKLIDWDTAALAPPERDLWDLDPGDGSLLRSYARATGYSPRESLLELYSLRWELTDLALYATDFRREHAGDDNSAKSWATTQNVVRGLVGRIPRPL